MVRERADGAPTHPTGTRPTRCRIEQPVLGVVGATPGAKETHVDDIEYVRIGAVRVASLFARDLFMGADADRANPRPYRIPDEFLPCDAAPHVLPGVCQTDDPLEGRHR